MTITFVLPPSLGAAKATARAELLESAVARALGQQVTAVIASTYAEVEARAADAELVWAPAGVCARLPAARAVFTIVRAGRTGYRSALVGLRDRALTLDTLAGTRAAWVDPLSAGGYLLVAALLRARGVPPERTFDTQVFAGSHRAAIEAVLHGDADVTAVSLGSDAEDDVAERLRWYAGPKGDMLTAIAFSDICLNDAIVVTTHVRADAAAELSAKLFPTTQGARARSLLLSALEADGLVRAELGDYHHLRRVLLDPAADRRTSIPPPRSTQRPPRSH